MTNSSVIDQPPEKLPPRTWRQWWRQTSSVFRIAVWGMAFLLGLHLALVVRIGVGWIEDSGIAALREKADVKYRWEWNPERFWGHHALMAGLWGKSPGNIEAIFLYYPGSPATDDDLQWIGTHAPNLRMLAVWGAPISLNGLESLTNLKQLSFANFKDCDLDDAAIPVLAKLPRLDHLILTGTMMSDEVLTQLSVFPSLKFIGLNETDVTPSPLMYGGDYPRIHGVMYSSSSLEMAHGFRATIRWSDGTRTGRFPGRYELIAKPLADDPALPERRIQGLCIGNRKQFSDNLRHFLDFSDQRKQDIRITLTLRLGDYESEPITYTVVDGKPSERHLVFRMPVSRNEAEQAERAKKSSP